MVLNRQMKLKRYLGERKRGFFLALLMFWSLKPLTVTAAPIRCEQVIFTSQEQSIADRFKSGGKDFYISAKFAKELQSLPKEERAIWIQGIGSVYRFIPKKDPNPTASWHIGGRRLLDYSLMLLERHDLQLAKLMGEGRDARFAYDNFLRQQNETFGSRYQSAEILAFAQYLQAELHAMSPAGPGPTLALGGSFINGKARLSLSDLDISVSDPQLMRFKNAWEAQLNSLLRANHPEAALTLEMHAVPASFYGKINPFVISIDKNQINLLVFEPARIANRANELLPGPFVIHEL